MFNELEFRAAIARVGLSIKNVADALNISTTTLYRKMSGESDFYRDEIQKICNLVGKEYLNVIFFMEKVS